MTYDVVYAIIGTTKIKEVIMMIYTKERDLFIRFLKSQEVYNAFLTEVEKIGSEVGFSTNMVMEVLFQERHPAKWVSSGLSWEGSCDGEDFWRKVDVNWLKELYQFTLKE